MSKRNPAMTNNEGMKDEQIESVMDRMNAGDKEQILGEFEAFRDYLAKRIKLAEAMGLDEEQMAQAAQKIAQYLSEHEAPRNAEEALLQELWKVGKEQERHALAHMLVRLARSSGNHQGSVN